VKIEVFRKQLQQAIAKFPDKLAVNVGDAMQESQGKFQATLQRERLNHPKSGPVQPPGGGLRRVTGSLSMSFDGLVERGSLDDVRLRLYSAGVKYAAIHEFGGTINHPGGTRYIFGPGGRAIFVSKEYVGPVAGVTKPHPITIPPRLGFFDTWEAHIESDLMPRLRKAVDKTIREGLSNS
jgi:phage gpG-like protein